MSDPLEHPHVPDEVIIKFKHTASQADRDAVLMDLGATHKKHMKRIKSDLHRIQGMSVGQAIGRYKNHPKIEYIEPNYIIEADENPNDPQFGSLWGMLNTGQTGGTPGADISATNAWDVFTGSSQVIIGVIDTGVDYTHPDLAANVYTNPGEIPNNGIDDDNNGFIDDVRGWDFYNDDSDPMDDNGHGTHVSGTIGAIGNNSVGVVGVNWNVRILPIKFLGGGGGGTTADAIDSVEYATLMGVHLTSNSWGGGGFSQALLDAIADAHANGILFVAAAGNSGVNTDNSPHYPSSYDLPNVISVAATDHNDGLAGFSNYGVVSVDLAAPGVNILSTFPGNSYGAIDGTSMATPHVSGVLGLVFGRFPAIGHLDAKNLVFNAVDVLPHLNGIVATGGRLNAFFPIADPDSTPPDQILDLAVIEAGSNWLDITWSATGDDGGMGTASRYIVKVSTSPIDDVNFDTATTVPNPPDPGAPGTPETMRVSGLDFDTTYYVALKALDEFGNASLASNSPSGMTLGAPDIASSPTSLTETLFTGATSTQTLTLSNVGLGTLDYNIPPPQLVTNPPLAAAYVNYGKDGVDPRPGVLGNGGPDGFGYRWVDSDEPGGPFFDWTDISGTGTHIISTGDDVNVGPFPLGFTFNFYGVEYTEFRVCSNGWLSFTSTSTAYSNQPLPNPGAPHALIAPFWDDLLGTGGSVYYESDGTRLIVQWDNVPHYGSGGPYTFQAILYSNGMIEYQYLTIGQPDDSCTIGIQNAAGSDGLQVVFNTAYVHDNLKIRIAAVPQWVNVSPNLGTIYAATSELFDVSLDASDLLGGTYEANIQVFSNDPDENPYTIPVTMTVIGAPDIELAPLFIDYGPVFIGATPTEILRVQNRGTDVLTVSSVTVDDVAYTLSPTSFTVSARGHRDVEITFTPTAVASHPATVVVHSNDVDEPSVSMMLSGQGVDPPVFSVSPTSLSSSLFTGEMETRLLTFSNAGGAILEWNAEVDFQAPAQTYTLTAPLLPSGADEDGAAAPAQFRTTPIQAEMNDLTGVHILWDRAHGQSTGAGWSTIIADVSARGATVTENTDPITPSLLAGYDVLWSTDCFYFWDAAEIASLVSWISAGGGLLFEGDNTATVDIFNELLFALNAGFLFSQTNGAAGPTSNIYPHATTENVTQVFYSGNVASIPNAASPAVPLVDDVNGVGAAAASRVGAGRIFGVSDEVFSDSHIGANDNQLFGNQVFDWLAGNNFLSIDPTAGTVLPGSSADVNVAFDATGLHGGLYQADIHINTNDPLAQRVAVPAALQVTGAPDLTLDPVSIDFGTIFIGYPQNLPVEIRNVGTDMLTITGVASDNTAFGVSPGVTYPIEIPPEHSTVLQVFFAPSAVTSYSGTLSVHSDDPDTPVAGVTLMGQGLAPPVFSVTPTSLSSSLFTGETEAHVLTVSNAGPSDLVWSAAVGFLGGTQLTTLTPPESPIGPDADGGQAASEFRTTPIQAELADLTGVDVLWDRAHGQTTSSGWSTIIADFVVRGATVTENLSPITPALLAGYDVIWSTDAALLWDAAETAALVSWMNAGGALLLEGDNPSTVEVFNELLTALNAGFLYDQTDGASGATTNVYAHPITEDVTEVHYTANLASIPAFVAPAVRLVDDVNGVGAAAASQIGAGRLFAATDEIFHNSRMGLSDNQLLGNQTMDWLARQNFLSVDPTSGTVGPGASVDIQVVFDPANLLGGLYQANVNFSTNDPATPQFAVPADLQVTGVPILSFVPTVVDFGGVFLGYPQTQVLTITNDGTDVLSIGSFSPGLPDYTVDVTSFDLDPFTSRDVQVTLDPQAVGDRGTTLSIASNEAGSPHAVPLAGFGEPPPVASVTPESLSTHLLTNDNETQTLTLSNSGGSDLHFTVATELDAADSVVVHESLDLGKNVNDPRVGILGRGGPDMFGYTWVDSDEPGGPSFDWVDISSTGTPVFGSFADDSNVGPLPIGFSFPFYGNDFSEFRICTNGWVSFTNTSAFYFNEPLPSSGAPENLLAVFWDDFVVDPTTGANVYYENDGSRLIIQYEGVSHYSFGGSYTFELFLYPNGRIVYQYLSMQGVSDSGTLGIQNATRDDGLMVVFNQSYVHDNLAVQLSVAPPWLSAEPTAGVVPPGGSAPIDVHFDATGLYGGGYDAFVTIESNDPQTGLIAVPAHLDVTGIPDLAVEPGTLDYGDVFVGYPDARALTLQNIGTDVLSITSITAGLADYTIDVTSFDLDPFASRQIEVTFDPQAAGDRGTTLSIVSNDPSSPYSVPLAGTGLIPPVASVNPESLSIHLVTNQIETQILTLSNTGGSNLVFSVATAYESTDSVVAQATPRRGERGSVIAAAKLGTRSAKRPDGRRSNTKMDAPSPGDAIATTDWLSVEPLTGVVPAGGSVPIAVTFDATGLFGGDYDAVVSISSNDPATGAIDAPIHLDVTGIPILVVEPTALDFGDVFIGYPEDRTLAITNDGTDVLSVTSIAAGLTDYTVDVTSLDLEPFESRNVVVTFDPQMAGDRGTTLSFASNDPNSPYGLSLAGIAVIPPEIVVSPDSIAGAALPGGSKTKTLSVRNEGGSDLSFEVLTHHASAQVTVYNELVLAKGTDTPGGEGEVDPRPGILGSGGPDDFGYRWSDSDAPGGPTYDWTDISAIGTPVGFPPYADDRNVGPIPIGFSFPFYGNAFTELHVCTNGWLSFTNSTSTTFLNQPLPNQGPTTPENLLAPWWDDLVYDESHGNEVLYHNDGSRLIIQFEIRRLAQPAPPYYRFQVILYPDGSIIFQYHTLGPTLNSATIGIQNGTRDDGLTTAFNDASYIHEELAIRFQAELDWLDVSMSGGVIPPGESAELDVTMDASTLDAGDHTGAITLISNDPARPSVSSSVIFHVGSIDAADASIEPQSLNLSSNGNWITAHVELPAEYDPADVVIETVAFVGLFPADPDHWSPDDDFNGNGIPDLSFKFDRLAVEELIPPLDSVRVWVSGEIRDTTYFVASDYVHPFRPHLLSPRGGEVLAAGSNLLIEWDNPQSHAVDYADLLYSLDDGVTWNPIVSGVQDTRYTWIVPSGATQTGRVRVEIYGEQGILGFDSNDEPFTVHDVPSDVEQKLPTVYALRQNVPNPFNPTTTIHFDLVHGAHVELRIFDVRGRVVRALVSKWMPAGRHGIVWDGLDRSGRRVASGLYLYAIEAGPFRATRRMTILK